ncbi:tripartite tricarboxylate transporter substrate binding protein [Xylophilus rhododendri]|uniref:Tripartite tricarboxylate transporter substrate binding protein n=2 Tax=Xylophilus rhododendri TaxID=2697032 RepID=A0A857JE36_9BURK|nr:tripartite tricarboxylate transporter substrate binding protein [Xylophilus rhododendri]
MAASGLAAPALAADAFPSRPIRLVVPFPAGGGTDLVARTLGEGMGRELGQPLIIDNKPGGGTVIGSDTVAKSPPDGYTLLLTTSALPINATLIRKLPYDTVRDFSPLALVCRGPNVLVSRPDSRYKTIADVIREAKARPGKLTYGSSGNGTAVHLAGELFKSLAGIDITHVPYRGAGPAMTDLLGGQIDFVFGTPGGTGKFVDSGKMRAIAITSAQRSAVFKGVPTIAETVPGYEADVWYALYAPGNTPPDLLARLNAAVRKSADAPEFRKRVEAEGLSVAVNTPQEMTAFERAEEGRWHKVIVDGHITVD